MNYRTLGWKIIDFLNLLAESLLGIDTETDLMEKIKPEIIRDRLSFTEQGGLPAKFLFNYHDPLIQKQIWLLKYGHSQKIAKLFAPFLYEAILEDLSDIDIYPLKNKVLIVAVPLSKKRKRGKGFNPIEMLSSEIQKIRPDLFEKTDNVLLKIRETKQQRETSSRNERLTNLQDAFHSSDEVLNRTIILIDDVMTTGATISECKKALRQAGARKVLCYTIAH